MNKKEHKNLISIYIQVILGFIGITSSFLIPLLFTYYFKYFNLTPDTEVLSAGQLNHISNNLTSLIVSIYTFIVALFISLILFAKLTFSTKKIDQKRLNLLLKSVLCIIILGLVFLVIALVYFLMVFIPNKFYILNIIILASFFVIVVFFMVFLIHNYKEA